MISPQLQRTLVLGELADLFLYRALLPLVKTEGERSFLRELAQTEEQHVAFWNERFSLRAVAPDVRGRLRNAVLWSIARVGGAPLLWLIVEAVEVSGIKKYLHLWEQVKDHDVREGLRTILEEELHHEDHAVTSQSGRKISPENIRNAFLGFNDGSVEILGAVSGFAAAFADPVLVAMSGVTVAVAGSLSMAAGAFLSTHGEAEMQRMAREKAVFLGGEGEVVPVASPWRAAALVGVAYFIGAAVPVAPFLFGAQTVVWSLFFSGCLILLVSSVLAFLSGMSLRRRLLLNGVVIVATVAITSFVGSFVEKAL